MARSCARIDSRLPTAKTCSKRSRPRGSLPVPRNLLGEEKRFRTAWTHSGPREPSTVVESLFYSLTAAFRFDILFRRSRLQDRSVWCTVSQSGAKRTKYAQFEVSLFVTRNC